MTPKANRGIWRFIKDDRTKENAPSKPYRNLTEEKEILISRRIYMPDSLQKKETN
jgi:hypothetical protein